MQRIGYLKNLFCAETQLNRKQNTKFCAVLKLNFAEQFQKLLTELIEVNLKYAIISNN